MTRSQGLPIGFGACLASLLIAIGIVRGGPSVGASVLVGVAVSLMSISGLARFAEVIRTGSFGKGTGHRLVLLFGLLKLPFVGLGLYLGVRLAGPFPWPLCASIILVYSCFVWFVKRSTA